MSRAGLQRLASSRLWLGLQQQQQHAWRSQQAAAPSAAWLALLAAGVGASSGLTVSQCKEEEPKRSFTPEEVAEHNTKEKRVWVSYKDGVYDVTDWLDLHPGGSERLMLAAGGAIDPFWAMYAQHQTPEVHKLLEGYRIGQLAGGAATVTLRDPYEHEPPRHKALVVRSAKPFNAEPPQEALVASNITPAALFYVRNHLPVPQIDAATHKVVVEGEGLRTLELSVKDLRTRFKKHAVTVTMQCTGNRRDELNTVKTVKGLTWGCGAISTAEFAGARLSDVLATAGLDWTSAEGVQHVQFEGADTDGSGTRYGASIPVEKALLRAGEVILAYEMNGSELLPDHGYPVRVVVPGTTGARSVKWLARVVASARESDSQWQQRDYKSFSPMVDMETVDWSTAPAIQETPVTSAITQPLPGSRVSPGTLEVQGYSFSGGGKAIIRVDVTTDGGQTWTTAELLNATPAGERAWAWTKWQAEVEVPQGAETLELWCRAVDASYNTQPEKLADVWNFRGVINNAYHRVPVHLAEE